MEETLHVTSRNRYKWNIGFLQHKYMTIETSGISLPLNRNYEGCLVTNPLMGGMEVLIWATKDIHR